MWFTSYICRWYAFLCKKSLSHAESTFRCSFRRLLSINILQTDGSSPVSVWPLTQFRRWIRGGIVVQVLVLAWMMLFRLLFELFRAFDVSKVPVLLPLYEVPLLTLLEAKIAIFVGYLMDGWWIFLGALFESSTVYKELSSKKCDDCRFLSSKKCNRLLQSGLFFFINLSYNK